jgi:hypothetical protein
MLRYQKHNYLVQNWQLSKLPFYNFNHMYTVSKIDIQAGHFKPNNTNVEHGLLVMNLSGQAPKIEVFKHGKRERVTLLIKSTASSK